MPIPLLMILIGWHFLKEVVNPLYAALLEFQNVNNIALEPYKKACPKTYRARNIFDIDFLNTDFYSELVYLPWITLRL